MEPQKTPESQNNSEQKRMWKGLSFQIFRCVRIETIKTIWNWYKVRHVDQENKSKTQT